MATTIIISFCVLLLIAYVFDISAKKTKIPSVILLLVLGWLVKQIVLTTEIQIPNFDFVLPILGTVGLILIVLEGSLELELNKSKFKLIRKSISSSLFPMLLMMFALGYAFSYFSGSSLKDSFTNAIPLCVISSAIAIPSASNLSLSNKEFVVYESSLSDIFGVILFNFFALNDIIDSHSFLNFGLQLLLIIVVTFISTIGLSFLLSKIDHHIKFIPIILIIILIYVVSKTYHLPSLLFIMLFGIFIGNLDELKRFKFIHYFKPDELNKEVHKFKELLAESAFLIRALFFILFGFLIETHEIINTDTLLWAIVIVIMIFGFRALQLKLVKLPLKPLLFIAPRGLITILLFLSIKPEDSLPFVNKSLILQVILISALVMMIGLMATKKEKDLVE
ncbi:MAG: cation:proton antiporter [Bacteroidetes bacterium]|nr:cation:proton antiporter [Bacteroidota bacterium]